MRITENKLRRIIRQVINESFSGNIDDRWLEVERSLRDDDYYAIDEIRMDFEDLHPDSPDYEIYRERFEDAAVEWMSSKGL
jgi:hypothetical protein